MPCSIPISCSSTASAPDSVASNCNGVRLPNEDLGSRSLEEWRTQVKQTRAQGFAVDAGNYIAGVTVVAAPVFGARGKLGHALVALGIGTALRAERRPALEKTLLAMAQSLSSQLGGETMSQPSAARNGVPHFCFQK
jgi:hypothetical protein